ncbi:hypothetical protein [Nocardia nova]|uniref:hypothetical protein n=1 Tax=Nocardia nova TaxID=37330 RepID=UPI0015E305D1|nr:hypothetical protein [Nocardia nova]
MAVTEEGIATFECRGLSPVARHLLAGADLERAEHILGVELFNGAVRIGEEVLFRHRL